MAEDKACKCWETQNIGKSWRKNDMKAEIAQIGSEAENYGEFGRFENDDTSCMAENRITNFRGNAKNPKTREIFAQKAVIWDSKGNSKNPKICFFHRCITGGEVEKAGLKETDPSPKGENGWSVSFLQLRQEEQEKKEASIEKTIGKCPYCESKKEGEKLTLVSLVKRGC